MTDLSDLSPDELRQYVCILAKKYVALFQVARWLLAICLLEAALIVWLLLP